MKAVIGLLFNYFFGFIVAFLFFNYSGGSIYDDPVLFRLVFLKMVMLWVNTIKNKLTPSIDSANPSSYLYKRDLKRY